MIRTLLRVALLLWGLKRPNKKEPPRREGITLYQKRELDAAALRLAHRTPAPYEYCKHVLDSCAGDERAAEAFIVNALACGGRG